MFSEGYLPVLRIHVVKKLFKKKPSEVPEHVLGDLPLSHTMSLKDLFCLSHSSIGICLGTTEKFSY